MRRRVLITGATGFVGANAARRMAARGHDVHCLLRPFHRAWRLEGLRDRVTLHDGDVADHGAVDRIFAAVRPEWVLHFAAYGAYESQGDAASCVRTNVDGTVNVVDSAARHGAERLVHSGTSSEYGFVDHPPAETERIEPNSLYAVTKAAATAYVRHAARAGRLHGTTLRLYSVYGPYEEPTRLIPALITCALDGTYPPLVGPAIARDFVYVDDVLDAYEAALTADVPAGSIYNIGTGVQTTLGEAVDVTRAAFRIAAEPQWGAMPPRRWDTTCWVANSSRANAELHWSASTSFAEGFERTATWLQADPQRRTFYSAARSSSETA